MTLIIGAGLAGLTCARILHEAGRPVTLVEAEEAVGGRVRSQRRNGYTFDRGFQVLFTRYPLVRRYLDLARLNLRAFDNGAIILRDGRRTRLADPLRHPGYLASSLLSPALTPLDKARLALLAVTASRRDLSDIWAQPDQAAADYLRAYGFSPRFIDNFARPFFGGIFLDRDLKVSARIFLVVVKMLTEGSTVVPAAGMGALTEQLAEGLPADALRLNTPVAALLREGERVVGVRTASGQELRADQVVVATEAPVAAALTGLPLPTARKGEVHLHFASPVSLYAERLLLLNANRDAFINDAAQISTIAPEYAPPGRHLLSCTVLDEAAQLLDDDAILARARAELAGWFGAERAAALTPLSIQRLPYCQFSQPPGFNEHLPTNATATPGLVLAGDYTHSSSIDGAMRSGEAAARLVLQTGA